MGRRNLWEENIIKDRKSGVKQFLEMYFHLHKTICIKKEKSETQTKCLSESKSC